MGADSLTSGLEGAWTTNPIAWDNEFLRNLFEWEWELSESPAGAKQWVPTNPEAQDTVPDAHIEGKRHAPVMLTSDLALRFDPVYEKIARRFYEHPEELGRAFAKAWYKLLHRDMGPISRYLGPWVPEPQLWQDPVPAAEGELIGEADDRRAQGADPGLRPVGPAAGRDRLGGGGELPPDRQARRCQRRAAPARAPARLGGQQPVELAGVLDTLERVRSAFGTPVSLADVIVLGGCAAVEKAAADAGVSVTVPFAPGRTDASQEQTDVDSFAVLEPKFDGFRNYLQKGSSLSPETLLVERANMLGLTTPELGVLVAGMRALDANYKGSRHGVFTDRPGTLTNDFFVNLLSMDTEWQPASQNGSAARVYEGRDRASGEVRWTATSVDLDLRRQRRAASGRRGVRLRRRAGDVRPALRGRLGQGHEQRPFRPPRLIATGWARSHSDRAQLAWPGRARRRLGRGARRRIPRHPS